MTQRGEMGTDLVGTAGDQPHFQKRTVGIHADRTVFCLYQASLFPFGPDSHLIGARILLKISFHAPALCKSACHKTPVVFVHAPVPQKLRHLPESRHGLSADDDAAGIPVQTVADGRAKNTVRPFAPLTAPDKIAQNIFIERDVGRRRLLSQHARRLVHQKEVLVLMENIQVRHRIRSRLLRPGSGKFVIRLLGQIDPDLISRHVVRFFKL
jgi:hypothetical protein